jgi:hypothetical protein
VLLRDPSKVGPKIDPLDSRANADPPLHGRH